MTIKLEKAQMVNRKGRLMTLMSVFLWSICCLVMPSNGVQLKTVMSSIGPKKGLSHESVRDVLFDEDGFAVQGKTPDEQWLKSGTQLKFAIATPFYLSLWAWAGYLLLLIGLIVVIVKFAAASAQRKADRLQQKVSLQTASISQKNQRMDELWQQQLVEVNQITIALDGEPGRGSRFTVRFEQVNSQNQLTYTPSDESELMGLVNSDVNADDETNVVAKLQVKEQLPLVLVVEAHPQMQLYLKQVLQGEYQVLLAENGEAGVACALENVPDLIVSDVMMPKKDGFELLNELKSHPVTNHIPLILLTARNDKRSLMTGLSYQADDYVAKPFDGQELRLKIHNLLNLRNMWHDYFQRLLKSTEDEQQDTVEASSITITLSPVQQALVDKLEDICRENCGNSEYSIEQMADAMAMGKRQLQRKIKALCGLSPLAVLKNVRLEEARIRIERGEQLTQVGYSCGFNSYQHFSRAFKEKYGESPKHYRQSLLVENSNGKP